MDGEEATGARRADGEPVARSGPRAVRRSIALRGLPPHGERPVEPPASLREGRPARAADDPTAPLPAATGPRDDASARDDPPTAAYLPVPVPVFAPLDGPDRLPAGHRRIGRWKTPAVLVVLVLVAGVAAVLAPALRSARHDAPPSAPLADVVPPADGLSLGNPGSAATSAGPSVTPDPTAPATAVVTPTQSAASTPAGQPGPTDPAETPNGVSPPAWPGWPGWPIWPTTPNTPAGQAGRDLARNRPASGSSQESSNLAPRYAFDGDPTTRWGSVFADPQWISVDLGAEWTVTRVELGWERSYATSYHVDISMDGSTWTTVYNTSWGTGGTVSIAVNRTARYVRMYGTQRAGGYGYSLYEFGVY
ncbi:discoidin domain-containing protein [Dactylosporangium sp. CA-233914]|uniref:discoidin domain-containing protein n=1 Tax=Dactylosporangium sp. CA-233914 TaxID=3239934 RepID=UPI003D8D67DD